MAVVPLGPFVRFAIMTGTAVWSNWDTISGLFDRHVEDATSPIYGYYLQNVIEFKDGSGTFSVRERGLYGIHYVNVTGGDLDTTWVTADYSAVESAWQTFHTSLAAVIPSDVRLVEHRWYPFGPGVIPPNPPTRVTTIGSPVTGTGSTFGAHQVACTVTFRTALRRHWGRIYLPMGNGLMTAGGQLSSTQVDTISGAARTALTSPNTSQGVVPVVYDRNRKAALGLTAIEVDSVPDIIRRRRPRQSQYKKIYTS